MRIALKVISPILLCWPTLSEADVGMAVEAELSQYCVTCSAVAAERHSDKMVSDVDVCIGVKVHH